MTVLSQGLNLIWSVACRSVTQYTSDYAESSVGPVKRSHAATFYAFIPINANTQMYYIKKLIYLIYKLPLNGKSNSQLRKFIWSDQPSDVLFYTPISGGAWMSFQLSDSESSSTSRRFSPVLRSEC